MKRGPSIIAQPFAVMLAFTLGILNDGKTVFQTKPVVDFQNGKAGTTEIAELALTVQRSGIIDDVVVDMRYINVGRHKKSIRETWRAAIRNTAFI